MYLSDRHYNQLCIPFNNIHETGNAVIQITYRKICVDKVVVNISAKYISVKQVNMYVNNLNYY